MEPFVHLHVHTEYSLLDGANRIPDLVESAHRDGHQAIAITDHGNLYGAFEFYKACTKASIKPILGCEVYVAEHSMEQKHHKQNNPYTHLTLLAHDAEGWKNLHQLVSLGHTKGKSFRPRIDLELLAQKAKGITCLSGCMSGPVNRRLRQGDEAGARAMAGTLQDMFGQEHFFLEIMRNGMEEQDRLTEGMMRMTSMVNAPVIATNDIHYLRHEDCQAQDALLCINTGKKIDDPDRWRMDTDTLFFRTREEMNRIFEDIPEALRNTMTVADKVNVQLEYGKYRLPVFTPEDGSTPKECFRKLCESGFARYYPGNPSAARERLEYEMRIIAEMGFVSYFLIVWDLIYYARSQKIPVGPGRGSAAGSMVSYVLDITRIDPLKYDLLFERFLNPGRISMPDIDIDFCKDRREEMLTYTRDKYGDERVCQIITFGKMKARAALRDVARVMDIPLPEVDQIVKKIPEGPGVTLAKAFDAEPELLAIQESSERNKKWFKLARNLEGLSRHSSVHAAGVIIADEPLTDIIPIAMQDDIKTTQWDMKGAEEFGLLKMDFLGLRTLSILNEAVQLVKKRHGVELVLDDLPLDDKVTFELLEKGDTEGIFQLESSGMKALLADLKPTVFEDIIAVLALYRPGPLGTGLHTTYARRKNGFEAVSYPHPLLEEILSETNGVLIYQEQIMRVAQRMGAFSLGEADSLRKAMGKKNADLMAEYRPKFMEGAKKNAVHENVASEIWETMEKFAEYGFNKSHSAAYSLVTWQTAYMKAHYPEEFYASTFTYEAQDTDKLATLIEDARSHNLNILPPCINTSNGRFHVDESGAIRFGLEAIKGVGTQAAENLIEQRILKKEGRFSSYQDFLTTAVSEKVNRGMIESLIKAGGCDEYQVPRLDLIQGLEEDLAVAKHQAKDLKRGQKSLFEESEPPSLAKSTKTTIKKRALSKLEEKQTLKLEKEALGLYLTRHPLDPYRNVLGGVSPWNSRTILELSDESMVSMAGLATHVEVRPTRKNPSRKIARLRVEDLHGSIAAFAWPSTVEECGDVLVEDFLGIFHGKVKRESMNALPELILEKIEPLGEPGKISVSGTLEIHVTSEDYIQSIQETLQRHLGSAPVRFHYRDPSGNPIAIRAGAQWKVDLGSAVVDELNQLLENHGRAQVRAERNIPDKAPKQKWAKASS